MILSGHQPNYWPYPGLIGKIMMSDKFIYVSNVQFDKKSWQNRNRIRTHDGWIWLTVPTLTKGKFTQNISEVEINNESNWSSKQMKSIEINYKKSPFYNEHKVFLEDLYSKKWTILSELNIFIMNYLFDKIEIKTKILYDKDFEFSRTKTEFLVNMTQLTNCNTYLSNKGSQAYVDIEVFTNHKMNHMYIDYKGIEYPQQFSGFEPYMSILDMLLNCGSEETHRLLSTKNNYMWSELNQKLD